MQQSLKSSSYHIFSVSDTCNLANNPPMALQDTSEIMIIVGNTSIAVVIIRAIAFPLTNDNKTETTTALMIVIPK
jgi:hypothetical protein